MGQKVLEEKWSVRGWLVCSSSRTAFCFVEETRDRDGIGTQRMLRRVAFIRYYVDIQVLALRLIGNISYHLELQTTGRTITQGVTRAMKATTSIVVYVKVNGKEMSMEQGLL
jgi:hypothetical protein